MKQIFRTVAFFFIGVALFLGVQKILTPNWQEQFSPGEMMEGLDLLQNDTVDVLFLGSSHMVQGMSPMRFYEDTKISSYSFATSSQTLEGSYFLLRKGLQHQTPSVVVLDVSMFFVDDNFDLNVNWRYILDSLPFDTLKVEMARAYGEKSFSDGMLSAIFPILKYHDRWSSFQQSDFGGKHLAGYLAGAYMFSAVWGTSWSKDDIDAEVSVLLDQPDGYITYRENAAVITEDVSGMVYEPKISEQALVYFRKIYQLCQEKGIDLVLTKIPVMCFPQEYGSAWTKLKSDIVAELADEYGVPFVDLTYDAEIGIDFKTDTMDSGKHLNIRGAEKVADYFASYLTANYNLNQNGDPVYDRFLEKYQKAREVALLQSETDFCSYLERLNKNQDNWTIFISVKDNYLPGMTEQDFAALDALGLEFVRDSVSCWNSVGWEGYLAVLEQGEVTYEARSNRRIEHTVQFDGGEANMASAGWYATPMSSVEINGVEHSADSRGFNFVVYDLETKMVIDSVGFDTYVSEQTITRNYRDTILRMRSYETQV